jgi:hypothetical protein
MVNLKTTKMPRLATILITLGAASLYIAPLAFAQSSEGRAPSVSESDGIPEPPAAVADDLSCLPISSTDGSSATADDSSGPPASHTDWEQVPEANSDATSGGDGQVLEVPQSTDPAQASNEGQDKESRNAPDELGGLNDYPYGYDPSDPYMLGYDPYLAWWYPAPVYYYSHRDRDNDCGDGNCGSRVGGHGGHRRPRFGIGTGTTLPGTPQEYRMSPVRPRSHRRHPADLGTAAASAEEVASAGAAPSVKEVASAEVDLATLAGALATAKRSSFGRYSDPVRAFPTSSNRRRYAASMQ